MENKAFHRETENTQMPKKAWVYDPQSGGVKIPPPVQPRIRQRIDDHAAQHYAGKYNWIDVSASGSGPRRHRGHAAMGSRAAGLVAAQNSARAEMEAIRALPCAAPVQ